MLLNNTIQFTCTCTIQLYLGIVSVKPKTSNICGYFDLLSNMLPRIEQLSISGNMLLTRSK